MGFDGNGNYTRTNGTQTGSTLWQDRAAILPATISASEHDAEMNDVATALTACIKADGSKTATNNQPMGGFKHTGVADATLSNQYATLGQVQTGLTVNDLVVSANNTGSALRVTQIGTGEALRVEDEANPDATPFVVTGAGDVGIGIASPSVKLQVEGQGIFNANSTTAGVRITQTGTGEAFRVEDETNPDTTPFVVTAAGFVGIGTSTPDRGLVVDSASNPLSAGEPSLLVTGSGNKERIGVRHYGTGDPVFVGQRYLGTPSVPTAVTADQSLLGLSGQGYNGTALSSTAAFVGFYAAETFTPSAQGTYAQIETTPTGSTTRAARVRVSPSGNIGIGTTNPTYQLQLSTDSAAKPTTNTWTIASDARIKTNIAPYLKGLAEVRQVNPITYDYNGKGGIPAGPGGVSIIAQDLQPVFPECVGFWKGKLEEGDTEEIDILNYNGHAITFALINAVKELAAKVEALEAEVTGLKGA